MLETLHLSTVAFVHSGLVLMSARTENVLLVLTKFQARCIRLDPIPTNAVFFPRRSFLLFVGAVKISPETVQELVTHFS